MAVPTFAQSMLSLVYPEVLDGPEHLRLIKDERIAVADENVEILQPRGLVQWLKNLHGFDKDKENQPLAEKRI